MKKQNKQKVYIETTIISYMTGRLSRDLMIAVKQQLTQQWWKRSKSHFELYVSEFVINELSAGDNKAAKARLSAIEGISTLEMVTDVTKFARRLLEEGPIPKKAAVDAFHIAIASVHRMDYLLTWNCTHIANAQMRNNIMLLAQKSGLRCPVICTPEELMGD